jgi:alkylhydroperoxidase family enzyme
VEALKDDKLVKAVLDDYNTAPIELRLKTTLGFLEKLTLYPQDVTAADATKVLEAGVSEQALADAIYVCSLFNIIDRVADTLGYVPNDAKGLKWVARILLGIGYGAGVV